MSDRPHQVLLYRLGLNLPERLTNAFCSEEIVNKMDKKCKKNAF